MRDPHNLSHSRKTNFFGCPARAGYESFYEGSKRTSVPYWLVGGGAVHFKSTHLVDETIAVGKVLPRNEVEKQVESARKHLYSALMGRVPPSSYDMTRLQSVYWMSEEEKARLDPDTLAKKIKEKLNRYMYQATPGLRAVALRCTVPSPFVRTETAIKFKLFLTSPRNSRIQIPILGEIDIQEERRDSGIIINDWKTGNFGHYLQETLEGNDQMLIYWAAVKQSKLVYPRVAYFISLNINKWDVTKYGERVLERDQYRVQARIRFEEHFPELVREYDDVWAVLNFLAYPPLSNEERKEREEWQPSSEKGRRFGLKRLVEQNRLIPSIGRHCGMCPARSQCRADNPEDWEKHEHFQKLGNVVDAIPDLIEEWGEDPFYTPEELHTEEKIEKDNAPKVPQLRLWGRTSVLKNYKFSAQEWKERGYFTPKEMVAILRFMHRIIPVVNGAACPCKKTKRIPAVLAPYTYEFAMARERYKQEQEAEGKTRSGEGENKVKEYYDTRLILKILKHCTVEGCPFPCLNEEEEVKVS